MRRTRVRNNLERQLVLDIGGFQEASARDDTGIVELDVGVAHRGLHLCGPRVDLLLLREVNLVRRDLRAGLLADFLGRFLPRSTHTHAASTTWTSAKTMLGRQAAKEDWVAKGVIVH